MERTTSQPQKKKFKILKIIGWIFGIVFILAIIAYAAFKISPYPSALLVRSAFKTSGEKTNLALNKFVKAGYTEIADINYQPGNDNALLDIYYYKDLVNTVGKLPTIVWIHGGGWVGGDKVDISSYSKLLAEAGYIVVSLNYTRAPEANFPVQIKEVLSAIDFLKKNSDKYDVDTTKIFLAGDSGGAHIVSVTANTIFNKSYSIDLKLRSSIDKGTIKGLILFCGPYDMFNVNFEGEFGGFLKTVLWSYSGTKDFLNNRDFKSASIINYVTKEFPPVFISVGNKDPLEPQSRQLARKLTRLNVYVDSLFFAEDYMPELSHEYQFDLELDASKTALSRVKQFMQNILNKNDLLNIQLD